MPGHIATAALSAVALAAPAHSAPAHLPLGRHVAADSSFAPSPPPAGRKRASRSAGHGRRAVHVHDGRVAHPAADPVVTIADFHFTPPTMTVHVGDTITWTNNGPSSHTATARDGSFGTGTLTRGQRASHAFTRAGTYAYVCAIHPFMHATITVLAAATTAPTASTTTTTTTTSRTPAAATTTTATTTATATPAVTATPTLPVTGTDVVGAVAAGAVLVACGLALRRAVLA